MSSNYYLAVDSEEYKLDIAENLVIKKTVFADTPIIGEGNNIGGEIYFLTSIDIPFDGNEKEIFEIGDIVYWRSQNENLYAIAVFYGNTSHGTGNAPTAASPCMKLGAIQGNCTNLESVKTGAKIQLICK